MKKVQILLSTYNGEKYVEEQMNSLLKQTYPNVEILIRDDGSTDQTLQILEKYDVLHQNVIVMKKKNTGVVKSFFNLIAESSSEADYFAFCDQDDIWKSDKVSRVIEKLESIPSHIPAMYCSQAELVDETLRTIGEMPEPTRGPSFSSALVQNIATGCTVVFNKAARQLLLRKLPDPDVIIMHDWWVYLVVSAFGTVIYDKESRILYRQHSLNSVGAKADFVGKWKARIKQFMKRGNRIFITKQVEEFRKIYGDLLPQDKVAILNKFIDGRKTMVGRIKYALFGEAHRQTIIDDVIFRILILSNRI
jgi:glycosyltransferase involved in cell wall biosynthesis